MLVSYKEAHTKSKGAVDKYSSLKSKNWTQFLLWGIIAAGICVRLFHFFNNRSLWIDEIYLSSSLVSMDFIELLDPLHYQQKAPLGFLWMSKLAVVLFGDSEMALRLFPLLCGIALLLVFLPVARHFLQPVGVVVAMGILAFAPPLVYHAVEAKQYATEALATAVALWLYIRYQQKQGIWPLVLWGFGGAVVIWFSFSSIFVLAGMAFAVCIFYALNKNWYALFRSFIPFSMWLVSFGVSYYLFTYNRGESAWLIHFFKTLGSFMPLPPTTVREFRWFLKMVTDLQQYPLGLSWADIFNSSNKYVQLLLILSPLSSFLLLLGVASFYKEDKKLFMVLVFPIVLVLLASGVELYPFRTRLILFLAPLLVLFVGHACAKATSYFKQGATLWRYALAAALIGVPLLSTARLVYTPANFGGHKKSSYREALLYVNDHFQEGDVVYLYWNFRYAYRFYKQTLPLNFEAIEGKDVRLISKNAMDYQEKLSPDIAAIANKKRVWVMCDSQLHMSIGDFRGQPEWYYKDGIMFGQLVLTKLAEMGVEEDAFVKDNVEVRLINLAP